MVDISAIGGAIGSIRAAGDIANAMLKLHDAKALQDKTIELNWTASDLAHPVSHGWCYGITRSRRARRTLFVGVDRIRRYFRWDH
jgi:hypothetical protein